MVDVKKYWKQKPDAMSLPEIVAMIDQMLAGLRKNTKMNKQKINKLIERIERVKIKLAGSED